MTDTPIRLVLVEDHAVVREGMKGLLELDGFAKVVASTASAEEALAALDRVTCDVVVLDISLPRSDGLSCARRIRDTRPGLRTLILSMHTEPDMVREALEAGASGYVLKSASFDEVKRAISDVHSGHVYVEPRLAGALLTPAARPPAPAPAPLPHATKRGLSARETQVLEMLARGHSNQAIAEALGLTVNTVKAHVKSVYRKLGITSRVGVVTNAMRLGLIDTVQ